MADPDKPVKETRHQRFLRLMQVRLLRTVEDLRLVSQLSSHNYQSQPHEVEEVLTILSSSVEEAADKFGYTYQATFLPKPKDTVSPRPSA